MNKKKSGFTLVELMIVVAIVAILAAIAIPMYGKYVKKSRTSEAVSNLGAIALYEETFYSENDRYQLAAANPSGTPPSPADVGGRKLFNSSLNGWASLGKVIPSGTALYFQYEILAGQITSGSTDSTIANALIAYSSTTRAGGSSNCSSNTNLTLSASLLSIPQTASSNWFYATAVGNQDGDNLCSLFVKVIDRTDLVVDNDIE